MATGAVVVGAITGAGVGGAVEGGDVAKLAVQVSLLSAVHPIRVPEFRSAWVENRARNSHLKAVGIFTEAATLRMVVAAAGTPIEMTGAYRRNELLEKQVLRKVVGGRTLTAYVYED